METVEAIVGGNIKRLRKQRGITQEAIAHYTGLDQTTISKIESGQRSAGISLLEKLCDLFFCSLDDMLAEAGSAKEPAAVAFRAGDFNNENLHAIASIGRIVRNLEEMASLEEALDD